VLKELVEHGNKNILKNVELHLIMEERSQEENNNKEITSGMLDVKREERGRAEVHNNIIQNNNNHNESWSRPRDKFGRFVSTATGAIIYNKG
jgi:hypothetical protein